MAEDVRIEAYFSGHVQGVGFRFTTIDVAARFPEIGGTVRNLPDGRVEVIAEGPEERLIEFIAALGDEMGSYIRGVDKKLLAARGEFSGFRVAR